MRREELFDLLKQTFSKHLSIQLRRPNLYQLSLPLYYPDGDMMDIFIKTDNSSSKLIICDCGLTIMHLSYEFTIDSRNKENILKSVLIDSGVNNNEGNLFLETTPDMLFFSIMQFSQCLERVYSMKFLKKEVMHNLFYENVDNYIFSTFNEYAPIKNYRPIADSLEAADYCLKLSDTKQIFIFATQGKDKTLRAIISMLTFQNSDIPFTSIVIHDNFSKLKNDDQKRVMNIADKQFYNYDSFKTEGINYINRLKNAS